MPKKLHHVNLIKTDRKQLKEYISRGTKSARSITRARILLLADEQASDEEIVQTLGVSPVTVHRIRKKYNEESLEQVLQEKARSGAPPKIRNQIEVPLTVIACSEPPEGRARWTLRSLANELVKLELVRSISHTEVGK